MMIPILAEGCHKAPFQLKIQASNLHCPFLAILEVQPVLHRLNLLYGKLLAQRYPVGTTRRTDQRALRLRRDLRRVLERKKPIGLRLPQEGLLAECYALLRNDDLSFQGLFLLLKGAFWDQQSLRPLGENHNGPIDLKELPQRGAHTDLNRCFEKAAKRLNQKPSQQKSWTSLIQKDYGFWSLLQGSFSVSFKLPPLNLLYQIFPIKQTESY